LGDCLFNWVGPIISALCGFLLKAVYDKFNDTYDKFKGECMIKSELEAITHNLDIVTRKNYKITPNRGANYILNHRQQLFGEKNTFVIGLYTKFDKYNSTIDSKSAEENTESQKDLMTAMENLFLSESWLKKIPSEPSIIGFIKYWLKRDAESTYIPSRQH